MNKKVLTFCAGVLLVGGSTVFTVNAINAGNGAPTTVVTPQTKAAEEVKGYALETASLTEKQLEKSSNRAWEITSDNYLKVKDAEWYLSANGQLVNDTDKAIKLSVSEEADYAGVLYTGEADEEQYLHIAANGNITLVDDIKEANARLYDGSELMESVSAKDAVALVMVEDQIAELNAENKQVVATIVNTAAFKVGEAETYDAEKTWANAAVFEAETSGENTLLFTEKNGVKLYITMDEEESGISLTSDASAASAITVPSENSYKLKLDDSKLAKYENSAIKGVDSNGNIWVYEAESEELTKGATSLENGKTYYIAYHSNTESNTDGTLNEKSVAALTVGEETVTIAGSEFSEDITPAQFSVADNNLVVAGYTENFYLTSDLSNTLSFTTDKKDVVEVKVEDNKLLAGDYYLVLEGESTKTLKVSKESENALGVYAIDKEDGVNELPADALNEKAQYALGQVVIEKVYTGTAVNPTAEKQLSTGYASEYGNQPNLLIGQDGTVTVIGSEISDFDVPVPVTGIGSATVILEDDYIKNLDAYKASPYDYTYAKITKADNAAGYKVEWVKKQSDATKVYFDNGNLVILDKDGNADFEVSVNLKVSTVTMPAAGWDWNDVLNLNCCATPLFASINSQWVLLGGEASDGKFYYFDKDGNLTDDVAKAEKWLVDADVLADGRMSYAFQSYSYKAAGQDKYLTIEGAWHFNANPYAKGFALVAADNGTNNGPVVFSGSPMAATIDNTGVSASTTLGLYRAPLAQFDAQWLLHHQGSYFNVNITADRTNANTTVEGDEFNSRELVPYYWDGYNLIEIEDDGYRNSETELLLKIRGKELFVVLDVDDKWSNVQTDLAAHGGYKFKTLSTENLKKVLNDANGELEGHEYYPYFRFNYNPGTLNPSDGLTYETEPYSIEVADINKNFEYVVITFETKDNSGKTTVFVTVNEPCEEEKLGADNRLVNISFHATGNIVEGSDAENNPLNWRYVNIKFKAGDKMQYWNNEGQSVNLNNKVLGVDKWGGAPMPSEEGQFLFNKPEGQWFVTMTEIDERTAEQGATGVNDLRSFTFSNRENPEVQLHVTTMHYMGDYTYAVEYASGNAQFGHYVNNGNWSVNRDTLVITPLANPIDKHHNMDGYANWTKEDLQDKVFQLSVDAVSQLYVTENEAKDSHFLGLSSDELDATNWRLVPFTAARVHDTDAVKYLTAGTDSVYVMAHPQKYNGNGTFSAYNDTTAIITYALQNISNNEWLTYDPTQSQSILSMICDPNSKKFTTDDMGKAYRFVLKQKAGVDQYNILGVESWGLGDDNYVTGNTWDKNHESVNGKEYYTLDYDAKLYGATTYSNDKKGAIEVSGVYDKIGSNDLFNIVDIASQEYVLTTPRDTVRIYGAEENDYLLYEKGQFLNLGNAGDIAPAMVLDTAYINRPGNNCYQYLIVVNPDYVEPVYDQLHGGDYHLVKPDTMKGRFLVNQIDSALFVSKNHNNKFINDIEADRKEVKLGFQWGYRTEDKLYLTDGQGGPVIETLDLGTADFNKAKFAFKYVNQAVDETFKVQTAFYDYDTAVKAGSSKAAGVMNNEGYLKSENGVIVVTDGYTHGEEFLMAPEFSDPTANETIAAEGAISVTATDGAVIIKGAAGKNVVIATILGKVVANETVNSDNETIAVPTGIAVVSVDGESFKVVVK